MSLVPYSCSLRPADAIWTYWKLREVGELARVTNQKVAGQEVSPHVQGAFYLLVL